MNQRVILVAPHFQEYCLLLANALAQDGEVALFIDRDRLESEYRDRTLTIAPNVTVRDMNFNSPLDPLRIFLARVKQREAILHIQEASGLVKSVITAAAAFLCCFLGPLVLTVHDPLPHAGRDAAIVSRIGRFRRYVRRKASLILVHGAYCRDAYIQSEGLLNQHIASVDHGVILGGDTYRPLPDRPLAMLHFGRMEAYKGIDTLYNAVSQLAAASVPFTLHIAGRGPELDRLDAQFKALPQVTVDNRFIPASELIEAIEAADCIVLPYLSATQSGVLAAAFAHGRFVIASDVGGFKDMIRDGENGLLVPPGDANSLAAAIMQVANAASFRAELARGAKNDAETRLAWSVIAEHTKEHYRAVQLNGASSTAMSAQVEQELAETAQISAAREGVVAIEESLGRDVLASDRKLLTIGIKALNEERHIERCLENAVAIAAELDGEVILADSGSTDRTLEIARRFPVRILQFQNPSERSCGAGAQLSFQQATGKYFYMLDGDMVLAPGFLTEAITFMENNPHIGGVGGLVNECNTANEEFQIRGHNVRLARNWLPGIVDRLDCGGLYRTDAVRELGYFADRNLHAFEEFELGARLRSNGWSLARIGRLSVDHYGHDTGGYRLLWRRMKSGYSGAPGEVLRSAIMRPHLGMVLRDLSHIRFGATVILLWVASLVAGVILHLPLVLTGLMLLVGVAFLTFRRKSLRLGLYSLAAWNVSALGLILGSLRKRTNPREPIRFKDVTRAGEDRIEPDAISETPVPSGQLLA